MKKIAVILSLLLCVTLTPPVWARKSSDPVTDSKTVAKLAENAGLFEVNPYVYHFRDSDARYWADKGLTKAQLKKEFEARRMVRDIAERTGYQAISSQGELTAGVLSYWAERLVAGEHPQQVEYEFRQLVAIQGDKLANVQARQGRQNIVTDAVAVRRMAEAFGLFEENPYAWTFEEGDVIWYSYQGMTEEELKKDFEAKARVRAMAREAKFYVAGHNGKITAGDLSYWAEFLIGETMTPDQMKRYFLSKSSGSSS